MNATGPTGSTDERQEMTKRKKKLEPLPGDRCIAEIGDYSGLEIWQGQMHQFGPVDAWPMSDDEVTTLRDELTAYLEGRYGCTDKEAAKLTSTVSIAASAAHASLAEAKGKCVSGCEQRAADERHRIFMALALMRADAMTWALNGAVTATAALTAYENAIRVVKGEA